MKIVPIFAKKLYSFCYNEEYESELTFWKMSIILKIDLFNFAVMRMKTWISFSSFPYQNRRDERIISGFMP